MAEMFLNDFSTDADIKKFEAKYVSEKACGTVSPSTHFEYAWCLIRSKYKADVREGISLLEGLCRGGQDQRDFLFFLGVGYYKLGGVFASCKVDSVRSTAVTMSDTSCYGWNGFIKKELNRICAGKDIPSNSVDCIFNWTCPDLQLRCSYIVGENRGEANVTNGSFQVALKYTKRILSMEPNNYQAKDLQEQIEKKMKNDGLLGMAIVSGVAMLGVAAGMLMLKKK